MWEYSAPLRDMRFVIHELLDAAADWKDMPQMVELELDSAWDVLSEAARFATELLAPSNTPGDLQGCRWADGRVTTPDSFANLYRQFRDDGWPALACAPEVGGQGLPQLLNAALYEMLHAANHAWSMYPGLAHGAYECLRAHGSDELKSIYLPKIVSGEWLATMCLTESQAGSDLGLIRTTARPSSDGTYLITGSKIFISGGEHDLSENIVHFVLARLPDAPSGSRGITLFLVPKLLGEPGNWSPNGISCDGIEKKMGIKGSATCVMRFNAAQGWLIGEPHRGLPAMFVMMNSARLYVALQGLGHAEAAYQNARRYAQERVQMRPIASPPGKPPIAPGTAAPIILHPGVRRTLLNLAAMVQGQRALAYWSAHLLDVAAYHRSSDRRRSAEELLTLLTPILKSLLTESGFELSSAALQIWGGYGYLHDYGIEQSLRDSRIAMIYEGTNEIQAIDLLVRKVVGDQGAKFKLLLDQIYNEAILCSACSTSAAQLGSRLLSIHDDLLEATQQVVSDSVKDPEFPYRIANDFLRLIGLGLLATFWCRAARVSAAKEVMDAFYRAKLETAHFFFDYCVPEIRYRNELLKRGCSPLPWLDTEAL